MGRKRKTRWRRLSIGEISANEEEEDVEDGGAVIVASRNNQHSPVKQIVDKSSTMTHINSSSPLENSSANNLSSNGAASSNHHNHYHSSSGGGNEGSNSNRSSPHNSHNNGHHSSSSNSSGAASAEPNSSYSNNHHNHHPSSHHHSHQKGDYHHQKDYYNQPHHNSHHHHNGSAPHHNTGHHYNGRGDYNHHHKEYNGKDYQNGSGEGGGGGGGDSRGGGGGGGRGGGGHYSGYHNNYYGSRNSYNNYRNSHYNNGEGGGGGGRNSSGGGGGGGGGGVGGEHYHGNGSDYHYSPSNRSYGGGRYRKPRSYPPSNYYYSNNGSSQDPSADHTNRPSYNQDEYTKITTPRQDVLFKKGYLSQKKSSSVDSTSATTTPSASTNGTPDTQSTNGINSDYSEGYENGETDCVIPYDDTIYYGPPPEAVFTDPNTGQVYYGHCSSSGEYFDAYPVSPMMVAGYPAPVYYHLPYPTVDWNGVPTPMYPVVAAPPPMPIDDPSYSLGLQGVDTTAPITRDRDTISTTPTPATSYTSTSTTLTSGMKGDEAEADVREEQSPTAPTTKSKEKNKDKASSGDDCSGGSGSGVAGGDGERKTTEAPTNNTTTTSKATTAPTSSGNASSNNSTESLATTSTTNPTTTLSSSSSSSTITTGGAITGGSSSTTSSPTSSKSYMPVTATATATAKSPESTQTYISSTTMSSAPIISHHQYQPKQHQHQYMAPVSYIHGNNLQNQHLHHHPRHHNHHHHHGGSGSHHPPPHHAVHHPPPPLALAAGPPPVHPPFHLYPHPAGFVYGHPVYNGVVVPIAPAASAADASNSSLEISPSSRKKRKKRRRKKDGQLTDEYSDETCSNPDDCEYDEVEEVIPDINYAYTYYYGPTPIGATQICVQGPGTIQLIPQQDNHLDPEPHHHHSATINITNNIPHGSDDSYSSYSSEPTSASSSELVKSKSQEDIAKAKDLLDQESSVPKEDDCQYKEDNDEGEDGEEEEESVETETDENNQEESVQQQQPEMDSDVKTEDEEASMNCSSDSNNQQEESNENNDSGNGEEETAESSGGTDESASTANVVSEAEQAVASSSVKSSSKKPVDLTVQCPPGGSLSNFAELQLLNLQRSPDGNNEPSSPDSLNTNQSVAGSEIAAGETLSVSESELMNRTTSIDEVEEDLPPEHTNEPEVYCESAYPSVEQPLSTSTYTDSPTFSPSHANVLLQSDAAHVENSSIQVQNENENVSVETNEEEEVKEDDVQVCVTNFESSLSKASPVSVSNVDVIASEELDKNVVDDETTKVFESSATAVVDSAEVLEAIITAAGGDAATTSTVESSVCETEATVENITTVASVEAAEVEMDIETMRPAEEKETVCLVKKSETNEAGIESGEGDEDGTGRQVLSHPETTERPKSITLAVSEWLKTQADDVLTPVIPPTSTSSEEVDDIEDEAEGDIEDSDDEEDDENNDEAQSKRIAELNQKNVHGNPCPATSNKSGSLSKKNRVLNRRSESKGKREHRPVNKKISENANFVNKGVCKDGVCSRVAHKLSSSNICNAASVTNSIITANKCITNQSSEELIASAASKSNTESNYDTNTKATTMNSSNSKLYDPASISKDEDSGLELSSPESSESSENKDLTKIVSWSKSKTFEQENMSKSNNKLGLTLPGHKTEDEAENVTNLETTACEKTPTSPPVSSSLPTPASSIDERNHAEICDPQKFAKYYQFGVVFDKDHDANNSEDSLVDNDTILTSCDCNNEDERESMFSSFNNTSDAAKTTNKSFAAVNASNLTTLKGQRQSMTVGNQHSESNEPVILKGYCDENDDEEIGTFDPRKLNRKNCNFKTTVKNPHVDFDSDGLTTPPPFSLTTISDSSSVFTAETVDKSSKRRFFPSNKENFPLTRKFSSLSTEDDEIDDEFDGFASAAYDDFLVQSSVSTPSAHMYVNPMSLAAELVSSSSSTKTPLPDTWDVDSEPLPPYESPPSVDISHVFNQNTPHAKIIRSKFHSTGEPVPCAICCSVM